MSKPRKAGMASPKIRPCDDASERAAACADHLADLIAIHQKPPLDVRVSTFGPGPRFMPIPPAASGCGSPAPQCVDFLS